MSLIIDHSILVVDDEESIGENIKRLLKRVAVKIVYASNGEDGLTIIKKTPTPFSIIISDQRMPGLKGHEFLYKAKQISPDSLRFLITGYSNQDDTINAVNKGAIHRYIAKPWENFQFIETVKNGLKRYEQIFDNDHLIDKAQKKSKKLYAMNFDLIRCSRQHKKKMEALESKIKELNKRIEDTSEKKAVQDTKFGKKAEQLIKDKKWMNMDFTRLLYSETINELSKQFQSLAERYEINFPDNLLEER